MGVSCPLPMFVQQEKVIFLANNKSSFSQACSVKMVVYRHCSILPFFFENYFFTFIKKQKRTCKIIASNTCIQPLWAHVWSITHAYRIGWASLLVCLQSFSFVPCYLMSNSIKTYTVIYYFITNSTFKLGLSTSLTRLKIHQQHQEMPLRILSKVLRHWKKA